jgi:hypothetical protein
VDNIEQVALIESFVEQLPSDVEDEFTGTPQQVSEWVLDEFKNYIEQLAG